MRRLTSRSLLLLVAPALLLMTPACCPLANVKKAEPAAVAPPDQDADGVPDAEDRCPAVAGLAQLGGCPDQDGDGVADDLDRCPAVAGYPEFEGCPPPDQDGDGVPDAEDACPTEAGPSDMKGCPDQDGDGIPDKDDACPDQAGTAEERGCLPKAVQRFSGKIQGITFATGKAVVTKGSHKTLDQAAAALAQYPQLRLEIQGHTDNVGDPAANLALSQARADAVKTYLVGKGIDASRLDAKGFGDSVPVADNKKAAGRAQNRRTEFRILGQQRRQHDHH